MDNFRQSGFAFMLFLWCTLIGTNCYSAEASTGASASVASPVRTDDAMVDFWGAAFMSKDIAGRLIIRIPGMDSLAEASEGADTIRYLAVVNESRFRQLTMADFIKRIASERILRGAIVTALTVSATDRTGFVTVTVAYN